MRRTLAVVVVALSSISIEARADDAKKESKKPEGKNAVETELVAIGPVKYPVPKSWTRQQPTSSMRAAQFGIPKAEGDSGKIELVVFYFDGGGGTVQDNIKRWLGQFKPQEGKEKIEKAEVGDLKVTLLDASGTYENKPFPMAPKGELMKDWRMLAAIVETPEHGPYFFRVVGPKKSIEAQYDSFQKMFKECKPGG